MQPEYGQHLPGDIVEGQHGIALSYEQEGIEVVKENNLLAVREDCCNNQCTCDNLSTDDEDRKELDILQILTTNK